MVVESQGGLGNQLFIWAYSRELQSITQVPVLLDTWRHSLTPNRPFELEPILQPGDYLDFSTQKAKPWRGYLARRISASRLGLALRPNVRRETALRFDENLLRAEPGDRLVGYFQSWKYFRSRAPQIRYHLQDFLSTRYNRPDPNYGRPTVAIHIRRGDFKHRRHRRAHPLLPRSYFRNALARLHEQMGDFLPVVYSDEPDYALDLVQGLCFGEDSLLAPRTSDTFEVLAGMSSHSSLIMSNSSLSWWAAWLMGFENNHIVIPNTWSNDPRFLWSDLIPAQG